jgi:hypothetical protein
MRCRYIWFPVAVTVLFAGLLSLAAAQDTVKPASDPGILTQAVICEKVTDGKPVNPAVIFPVSAAEVVCFTAFKAIDKKDVIIHNWIRRDETVARIKLTVEPPRWATYSGITLRETDKGPWRIEIMDSSGRILKILRFSITD